MDVGFRLPDDAVGLSRIDAAEWLSERGWPISEKTLANLAWKKKGPRYVRWGKPVTYDAVDLRLWAEERIRAYNEAA